MSILEHAQGHLPKVIRKCKQRSLLEGQLIERIVGCGELVEPEVDPEGFVQQVKQALTAIPPVYNPINGRMMPWVDVSLLVRHMKKHNPAARKSSNCAVM